jgi:5-oxoprolinase (ATP-hydrolysing)
VSRCSSFAIDRGGTFTDIVAYSSDGRQRMLKLLSEDPQKYDDAALEGIRRLLAEEGGTVSSVRMRTTVQEGQQQLVLGRRIGCRSAGPAGAASTGDGVPAGATPPGPTVLQAVVAGRRTTAAWTISMADLSFVLNASRGLERS